MKRLPLVLAATCLSAAPFAFGETDAANAGDETIQLEKFVTLASTTDRANNVLSTEQLAAASPADSAIDLLQHLPGVLVNQGDAYGSDDWSTRIYVRGFQAGQLGFSIDGVPNGNTNYGGGTKPNRFIDPENVSVVSVTQGSSDASSAGAQALGGTFDYSTITPSKEQGLLAAVSMGDNQLQRYFVRFNTGLLAGHTKSYLSLSRQTHHRWMDEGSEAGVMKRTHIDAKSVSTFGTLSVAAKYSYDDIFEPNYNSLTLSDYAKTPLWDQLTGTWTGKPYYDQNYIKGWNTIRKNSLASLDLHIDVSDTLTLHAEPYWQHQRGTGGWLPPYWRAGWDANGKATSIAQKASYQARVFFVDASGNPLYVGSTPSGVTSYSPSNPYDITTYPTAVQAGAVAVQSYRTSTYLFDRPGTTFGADWKPMDGNNAKFGGWYEDLHRQPGRTWHKILDTRMGWESSDAPYWSDFLSDMKTKTLSLYAQDSQVVGPVTLTAAVRKYFVDLHYADQYGVRASRSLNSDSGLLPSLGLVYKLGQGMGEFFGGYSKNFKAIEDNVIASTSDLSKSLEPETSNSYDLGYRVNAGHWAASVSAYSITFNNRIESITPITSGGVTTINYDIGQNGGYVNVGGIRSKGVEVALNNALTSKFGAGISLTLNDSKYTHTIVENGVVEGKQVTGSPREMVSASVFYRDSGYHASLTGKYTGLRYGTLDNKERLGGYTLFDAVVGYSRAFSSGSFVKQAGIDLRVQNLLDRRYLAGLDGDANVSTGYYFIGTPRTVSLSVNLEF